MHNQLHLDLSEIGGGDGDAFGSNPPTLQPPISQPPSNLSYIDLNALDMLSSIDQTWDSSSDQPLAIQNDYKPVLASLNFDHHVDGADTYPYESSSLASIVTCCVRDSVAPKYRNIVGPSLQQICLSSLDPSQSPWMYDSNIGRLEQGRPVYDKPTVMMYTEAYFGHFVQKFPYITQEQVSFYVHAFLGDNFKDDSAAVGLINTMLAQGCRLVLSTKTGDYDHATTEAKKYYAAALNARSRLVGVQPSILTIQSLVAMTIHARDLQNLSIAYSLVSSAVQHCLALKLHRIKSLRAAAKDQPESELLQRLFWVVYSLEKPLAMRLGRSSAINDESIDYTPRMLTSHSDKGNYNTFLHYCEWAKMCSQVVSKLYRNASSAAHGEDIEHTTSSLTESLQSWRISTTQSIRSRRDSSCSIDDTSDQVDSLLRYHELTVTILHQ